MDKFANKLLTDSLTVMLVNLTSVTRAADNSDSGFMVLSNGMITCGEFLSDNLVSQQTAAEWVLGYISGRNRESSQGSRLVGTSFTRIESVTAWVQNYCRNHAPDPIVDAADSLRAEFLRRESSQ